MTITIGAGSNQYAFAMSTSYTGSTGSETPDGTTVYLFPQKFEIIAASKDRRRVISNFAASKVLSGKYDLGVRLSKVYVTAVVKSTGVEELDYIRDFIRTYGAKVGGSKVYAFMYNFAAAKYYKLSWNASHTQLQYLKGHPEPTVWGTDKGDLHLAQSFLFFETTI